MASGHQSSVLGRLRSLVLARDGAGLTDGQLLERFLAPPSPDAMAMKEAAFAALVRRHGPLVLGVCRRVLRDAHAVEDAFQATFLVLVRKAAAIRQRELLANWLYGVACRTAREAKARAARRHTWERPMHEMPTHTAPASPATEDWHDLRPLLDQELQGLPDKYRSAIVLCDLEGKSRKEAARQLGCKEGTLSGRLARARRLLAGRLTRRGVTLPGGALATVLAQETASAAVPTALMVSTVEAAMAFAAGGAAAGVVSASAVALTEGVLKAMFLTKLKITTAVVLALSLIGSGLGVLSQAQADRSAKEDQAAVPNPAAPKEGVPQAAGVWKERQVIKDDSKADQIFAVALSPDGTKVAAGQSQDGKVWDALTGQELATLNEKVIWSLAFSPDGGTLASGHIDGTIKLWDPATGQERRTLAGHTKQVRGVVFAPDGKTLVSTSVDGTLRLWEVATGNELWQVMAHKTAAGVALSSDGKQVATAGGFDKTVKLWDAATGKELATLSGHTNIVYCVAFSPDGKTLASGSADKTVKLWDLATGKEKATLQWHVDIVTKVAFSPDGKTLASLGGNEDKTVQIWDAATGKELQTLREHTEQLWSLAFSRDGKTLATAGDDAVRVWGLEPVEKK